MGVFGLLKHCDENDIGLEVDLFEVATERGGIELLIDFRNFYITAMSRTHAMIRHTDTSWITVSFLGGEYFLLNKLVKSFCDHLTKHGVTPVFFDDGPRGSDPVQFVKKMGTWIASHKDTLLYPKYLDNYLQGLIDADELGGAQMPCLAETQVKTTLKNHCLPKFGAKFFACKGEADDIMAKYLIDTPEAYAILSNDGDFCVMKDCRFISHVNFPWGSVFAPLFPMGDTTCKVKVYTPPDVALSLGLSNQQELVDIAILAGNDFTKPLLDQIWEERTALKDSIKWYRENVEDGILEDCAQFKAILEKNPELKDAVRFSRRFYNLEDVDRLTDRQTTEQSALRKYIVDSVNKFKLPDCTLAYLEGQHFGSYLVEDLLMPSIEGWTQDLSSFIYNMCTEHRTMKIISRSNDRDLDEQEIILKNYQWLPKAHEIPMLDDQSRWMLFDRIVSHLEDPVDRLTKENIYNGNAIHHFIEKYGTKKGYIMYAVNYLLTITYIKKKCVLETWEMVSILSTAMKCVSKKNYTGNFKPIWRKPTMRCLTMGNWYQYIVKVMHYLSRVLLIFDEFPEPHEVYRGMYFTSLYMALSRDQDYKNGNVDPSVLEMLKDIVEDNQIFDEDTKMEIKSDLGFIEKQDLGNLAATSTLPIEAHKDRILEHINKYRVTCIEGETGSGKSTKVPQFILEHCQRQRISGIRVSRPNIIVTQPRRLAAKSLAERVAREIGDQKVGHRVGYKIGQDHTFSDQTLITYCTTGYMIELLVHNPRKFNRFTHIILDEIHERDLDADLMSLMVHLLMKEYTRPKVIIMSATLQAKLFVRYFCGSQSVAASMKQHLFVGVTTPYTVEQLYIEDLVNHYGDSLKLEGQARILKLFCEFHNMSIADLIQRKFSDEDDYDDNSDEDSENSGFIKIKALATKLIAADYLRQRDISYVHRGRVSLDKYLEMSVPLVQAVSKPGESILIFLPGKKEIEEIHDLLITYQDRKHFDWACKITLFILHSSVPFEDQQECFDLPPPNTCHVILATNIAESSLTLPLVTVIIDFRLRRQLIYDFRRRVRCLQTGWCSKASMMQRKGRTGRMCDGVCIRIMSKTHFDRQDDFDKPQMKVSPLDKLILQVKYVGESIAPDKKPSELLAQSVEPPNMDDIHIFVKNLADIGALTAADECASVTLLGKLAMSMPLDLYLCRLILFGCLFGCPCDAVVMAAALQSEDTFKKPAKKVMKNQEMFIRAQRKGYNCRRHFDKQSYDKQSYSEPIMFRNLYKTWLQESISASANREDQSQFRSYSRFNDFPRRDDTKHVRDGFCDRNELIAKRLTVMEGLVFDLANTVLSCVPEKSENCHKLQAFLDMMPKIQKKKSGDVFSLRPTRSHAGGTDAGPALPSLYRIQDLFSEDNLLLTTILAASLAPRFVYGSVQECQEVFRKTKTKKEKISKNEKLEIAMAEAGVDPKKTVCLPGLPEWLMEDEFMLNKVVRHISLIDEKSASFASRKSPKRGDSSQEAGVIKDFKIVPQGKRVFVEYHTPTIYEKKADPRKEITLDLHYYLQYPYQFSEAPGRDKFLMDLPSPSRESLAKNGGESRIYVDLPENPFRIDWSLMSADGNPLRKGNRTICGWRNPIGFSCDLKKRNHFGVAATYTKAGLYGTMGWADGVSMFPCYQDNLYAVVLMLAFLPSQHGVKFVVDTNNVRIHQIEIFEYNITVPTTYPLYQKMLEFINEIRAEISNIFINQEASSMKQIPVCQLSSIYRRLMHEMSLKDPTRPSHQVQARMNEGRKVPVNSAQSQTQTSGDMNVNKDKTSTVEATSTHTETLDEPTDESQPKETLPDLIVVNAFNVSEAAVTNKNATKQNWRRPGATLTRMLEDQDNLQLFQYLVPYDMKVFDRNYLHNFHKKQEKLLHVEVESESASSESESSDDAESSEESDEENLEYISMYSPHNPKMLLNSLYSVVNSQVSLQSVPSLASELWETDAVEEIIQKLDAVFSAKSGLKFKSTLRIFLNWIKQSKLVVAKVKSDDMVVCSMDSVIGKYLFKLLQKAKREQEKEIVTLVYCDLLERKNKSRKFTFLVKHLKTPLKMMDQGNDDNPSEDLKMMDQSNDDNPSEDLKMMDQGNDDNPSEGLKMMDQSNNDNPSEDLKMMDQSNNDNPSEDLKMMDQGIDDNPGEDVKMMDQGKEANPSVDLMHVLSKHNDVFEMTESVDGNPQKQKVKIKDSVYEKIKASTDRARKMKEVVRQKKLEEKVEERYTSKISLSQRIHIREKVYDYLIANGNIVIAFKDLLSITSIYDVYKSVKMNFVKEFNRIFTATRNQPNWFQIGDETVRLTDSVYEAYQRRKAEEEEGEVNLRTVKENDQAEFLFNVEIPPEDSPDEDAVADNWEDIQYETVSDDVIDLCLSILEEDIISKAMSIVNINNSDSNKESVDAVAVPECKMPDLLMEVTRHAKDKCQNDVKSVTEDNHCQIIPPEYPTTDSHTSHFNTEFDHPWNDEEFTINSVMPKENADSIIISEHSEAETCPSRKSDNECASTKEKSLMATFSDKIPSVTEFNTEDSEAVMSMMDSEINQPETKQSDLTVVSRSGAIEGEQNNDDESSSETKSQGEDTSEQTSTIWSDNHDIQEVPILSESDDQNAYLKSKFCYAIQEACVVTKRENQSKIICVYTRDSLHEPDATVSMTGEQMKESIPVKPKIQLVTETKLKYRGQNSDVSKTDNLKLNIQVYKDSLTECILGMFQTLMCERMEWDKVVQNKSVQTKWKALKKFDIFKTFFDFISNSGEFCLETDENEVDWISVVKDVDSRFMKLPVEKTEIITPEMYVQKDKIDVTEPKKTTNIENISHQWSQNDEVLQTYTAQLDFYENLLKETVIEIIASKGADEISLNELTSNPRFKETWQQFCSARTKKGKKCKKYLKECRHYKIIPVSGGGSLLSVVKSDPPEQNAAERLSNENTNKMDPSLSACTDDQYEDQMEIKGGNLHEENLVTTRENVHQSMSVGKPNIHPLDTTISTTDDQECIQVVKPKVKPVLQESKEVHRTPEEEKLYNKVNEILCSCEGNISAQELAELESVSKLWNKVRKQFKYVVFGEFLIQNFETVSQDHDDESNVIVKGMKDDETKSERQLVCNGNNTQLNIMQNKEGIVPNRKVNVSEQEKDVSRKKKKSKKCKNSEAVSALLNTVSEFCSEKPVLLTDLLSKSEISEKWQDVLVEGYYDDLKVCLEQKFIIIVNSKGVVRVLDTVQQKNSLLQKAGKKLKDCIVTFYKQRNINGMPLCEVLSYGEMAMKWGKMRTIKDVDMQEFFSEQDEFVLERGSDEVVWLIAVELLGQKISLEQENLTDQESELLTLVKEYCLEKSVSSVELMYQPGIAQQWEIVKAEGRHKCFETLLAANQFGFTTKVVKKIQKVSGLNCFVQEYKDALTNCIVSLFREGNCQMLKYNEVISNSNVIKKWKKLKKFGVLKRFTDFVTSSGFSLETDENKVEWIRSAKIIGSKFMKIQPEKETPTKQANINEQQFCTDETWLNKELTMDLNESIIKHFEKIDVSKLPLNYVMGISEIHKKWMKFGLTGTYKTPLAYFEAIPEFVVKKESETDMIWLMPKQLIQTSIINQSNQLGTTCAVYDEIEPREADMPEVKLMLIAAAQDVCSEVPISLSKLQEDPSVKPLWKKFVCLQNKSVTLVKILRQYGGFLITQAEDGTHVLYQCSRNHESVSSYIAHLNSCENVLKNTVVDILDGRGENEIPLSDLIHDQKFAKTWKQVCSAGTIGKNCKKYLKESKFYNIEKDITGMKLLSVVEETQQQEDKLAHEIELDKKCLYSTEKDTTEDVPNETVTTSYNGDHSKHSELQTSPASDTNQNSEIDLLIQTQIEQIGIAILLEDILTNDEIMNMWHCIIGPSDDIEGTLVTYLCTHTDFMIAFDIGDNMWVINSKNESFWETRLEFDRKFWEVCSVRGIQWVKLNKVMADVEVSRMWNRLQNIFSKSSITAYLHSNCNFIVFENQKGCEWVKANTSEIKSSLKKPADKDCTELVVIREKNTSKASKNTSTSSKNKSEMSQTQISLSVKSLEEVNAQYKEEVEHKPFEDLEGHFVHVVKTYLNSLQNHQCLIGQLFRDGSVKQAWNVLQVEIEPKPRIRAVLAKFSDVFNVYDNEKGIGVVELKNDVLAMESTFQNTDKYSWSQCSEDEVSSTNPTISDFCEAEMVKHELKENLIPEIHMPKAETRLQTPAEQTLTVKILEYFDAKKTSQMDLKDLYSYSEIMTAWLNVKAEGWHEWFLDYVKSDTADFYTYLGEGRTGLCDMVLKLPKKKENPFSGSMNSILPPVNNVPVFQKTLSDLPGEKKVQIQPKTAAEIELINLILECLKVRKVSSLRVSDIQGFELMNCWKTVKNELKHSKFLKFIREHFYVYEHKECTWYGLSSDSEMYGKMKPVVSPSLPKKEASQNLAQLKPMAPNTRTPNPTKAKTVIPSTTKNKLKKPTSLKSTEKISTMTYNLFKKGNEKQRTACLSMLPSTTKDKLKKPTGLKSIELDSEKKNKVDPSKGNGIQKATSLSALVTSTTTTKKLAKPISLKSKEQKSPEKSNETAVKGNDMRRTSSLSMLPSTTKGKLKKPTGLKSPEKNGPKRSMETKVNAKSKNNAIQRAASLSVLPSSSKTKDNLTKSTGVNVTEKNGLKMSKKTGVITSKGSDIQKAASLSLLETSTTKHKLMKPSCLKSTEQNGPNKSKETASKGNDIQKASLSSSASSTKTTKDKLAKLTSIKSTSQNSVKKTTETEDNASIGSTTIGKMTKPTGLKSTEPNSLTMSKEIGVNSTKGNDMQRNASLSVLSTQEPTEINAEKQLIIEIEKLFKDRMTSHMLLVDIDSPNVIEKWKKVKNEGKFRQLYQFFQNDKVNFSVIPANADGIWIVKCLKFVNCDPQKMTQQEPFETKLSEEIKKCFSVAKTLFLPKSMLTGVGISDAWMRVKEHGNYKKLWKFIQNDKSHFATYTNNSGKDRIIKLPDDYNCMNTNIIEKISQFDTTHETNLETKVISVLKRNNRAKMLINDLSTQCENEWLKVQKLNRFEQLKDFLIYDYENFCCSMISTHEQKYWYVSLRNPVCDDGTSTDKLDISTWKDDRLVTDQPHSTDKVPTEPGACEYTDTTDDEEEFGYTVVEKLFKTKAENQLKSKVLNILKKNLEARMLIDDLCKQCEKEWAKVQKQNRFKELKDFLMYDNWNFGCFMIGVYEEKYWYVCLKNLASSNITKEDKGPVSTWKASDNDQAGQQISSDSHSNVTIEDTDADGKFQAVCVPNKEAAKDPNQTIGNIPGYPLLYPTSTSANVQQLCDNNQMNRIPNAREFVDDLYSAPVYIPMQALPNSALTAGNLMQRVIPVGHMEPLTLSGTPQLSYSNPGYINPQFIQSNMLNPCNVSGSTNNAHLPMGQAAIGTNHLTSQSLSSEYFPVQQVPVISAQSNSILVNQPINNVHVQAEPFASISAAQNRHSNVPSSNASLQSQVASRLLDPQLIGDHVHTEPNITGSNHFPVETRFVPLSAEQNYVHLPAESNHVHLQTEPNHVNLQDGLNCVHLPSEPNHVHIPDEQTHVHLQAEQIQNLPAESIHVPLPFQTSTAQLPALQNDLAATLQSARLAIDEFCLVRNLKLIETIMKNVGSEFHCVAMLCGKGIAEGTGETKQQAALQALTNALYWLQNMFN